MVIGQLFAMTTEKLITIQTFTSLYHLASNLLSKFLSAVDVAAKLLGP
jgi:hypothetical protein